MCSCPIELFELFPREVRSMRSSPIFVSMSAQLEHFLIPTGSRKGRLEKEETATAFYVCHIIRCHLEKSYTQSTVLCIIQSLRKRKEHHPMTIWRELSSICFSSSSFSFSVTLHLSRRLNIHTAPFHNLIKAVKQIWNVHLNKWAANLDLPLLLLLLLLFVFTRSVNEVSCHIRKRQSDKTKAMKLKQNVFTCKLFLLFLFSISFHVPSSYW